MLSAISRNGRFDTSMTWVASYFSSSQASCSASDWERLPVSAVRINGRAAKSALITGKSRSESSSSPSRSAPSTNGWFCNSLRNPSVSSMRSSARCRIRLCRLCSVRRLRLSFQITPSKAALRMTLAARTSAAGSSSFSKPMTRAASRATESRMAKETTVSRCPTALWPRLISSQHRNRIATPPSRTGWSM
ncbi:hypothetical protein D9M72_521640 [compost metagenome]